MRLLSGMLPRPVYEALPYLYMVIGALGMGQAVYIAKWHPFAPVYFTLAFFTAIAGVHLWKVRMDYRERQRAPRRKQRESSYRLDDTRMTMY